MEDENQAVAAEAAEPTREGLEDLRRHVAMLGRALEDAHPGLASWQEFYSKALERVAEWSPNHLKTGEAGRELLEALERINLLACYASEENTDSWEQVLLQIGLTAREAIAKATADSGKSV